MFRCGQWADNTPWFSSRGCIQPELPAAGREQRRSPPGEHESSLGRRAPGGKRGPAVGGGSAGAGTAARRAPPHLASWNSRALPPMAAGARPGPPAAGESGPAGDLGARSRQAAREGRAAPPAGTAHGERGLFLRISGSGHSQSRQGQPVDC